MELHYLWTTVEGWNLAWFLLTQSIVLLFSLETANNHCHHTASDTDVHTHSQFAQDTVIRKLGFTAPLCTALPSIEEGHCLEFSSLYSAAYLPCCYYLSADTLSIHCSTLLSIVTLVSSFRLLFDYSFLSIALGLSWQSFGPLLAMLRWSWLLSCGL